MIRPAGFNDYAAIADLWLEASLLAHRFIDAGYWREMLPLVKREYIPAAQTFVFEDHHKIKGFISLLPENYIGALFISPQFQNQGIGGKLLEYVRRQKPHFNLKVFTKNQNALGFYRHAGFKIVAAEINDDIGEEELLMAWAKGCKSNIIAAS